MLKIHEQVQEQLEHLWIIEEEAGESTAEGLQIDYPELIRMGLVRSEADGMRLTPDGKLEAARAIRRHRLAERLVSDVLVTEDALVDEHACTLEHALMDGIEESICTLLGHPTTCPHGKRIPPGRCCQNRRRTVGTLIAPLNELENGQHGRIAYLHLHDSQHLQKLMAMGVLPGAPVKVKATSPSIVFEAGFSQFAVDEAIAGEIFIRLDDET
jgi:DtxR family Mn-dependent transcriptional regulator